MNLNVNEEAISRHVGADVMGIGIRLEQRLVLRSALEEDLHEIIRIGKASSELAFGEWENLELLERIRSSHPKNIQVMKRGEDLVGFVIGGSFGVRGTISHLWVSDECRGVGIGKVLTESMMRYFSNIGVRRVHVMTVEGNELATAFWQKNGFQLRPKESFLEYDI